MTRYALAQMPESCEFPHSYHFLVNCHKVLLPLLILPPSCNLMKPHIACVLTLPRTTLDPLCGRGKLRAGQTEGQLLRGHWHHPISAADRTTSSSR